jgi:hypothetical protein
VIYLSKSDASHPFWDYVRDPHAPYTHPALEALARENATRTSIGPSEARRVIAQLAEMGFSETATGGAAMPVRVVDFDGLPLAP